MGQHCSYFHFFLFYSSSVSPQQCPLALLVLLVLDVFPINGTVLAIPEMLPYKVQHPQGLPTQLEVRFPLWNGRTLEKTSEGMFAMVSLPITFGLILTTFNTSHLHCICKRWESIMLETFTSENQSPTKFALVGTISDSSIKVDNIYTGSQCHAHFSLWGTEIDIQRSNR